MADLSSCYFCATVDASLEEYPVVPDTAGPSPDEQATVVLCPGCRRKLDRVLERVTAAVRTGTALEPRRHEQAELSESVSRAGERTDDPDIEGDDVERATETQGSDASSGDRQPGTVRESPEPAVDAASDPNGAPGDPETDSDAVPGPGSDEGSAADERSDSRSDTNLEGGDASAIPSPGDPKAPEADSEPGEGDPDDGPSEGERGGGQDKGTSGESPGGTASTPDSGADDAVDGPAVPTAEGTPAGEPDLDGAAGEDRTAADSGGERAVNSGEEGEAAGSGGENGPAGDVSVGTYNRVIRLLQNREFPVERAEFEPLAANAYEIDPEECAAALDAAVEKGLLVDRDGTLRRPE